MRRLIALILCVMLCVGSLSCASAAESWLLPMYSRLSSLLFDTDNVSVNAKAALELDGERIKDIEFTHIQVNGDFLRDISMNTQLVDTGAWKPTGYTILSQGDRSDRITSYDGVVESSIRYEEKHSILRRSMSLNSIDSLCWNLTPLLQVALPASARTMDGTTTTISLHSGDIPEVVNSALMLLMQFYGQEARGISYTMIGPGGQADIQDYCNYVEGILYCTEYVMLTDLELSITLEESQISAVTGQTTMLLNTGSGRQHTLVVFFDISVYDYGCSVLPELDLSRDSQWLK